MTRTPPLPPRHRTIHVVGDIQDLMQTHSNMPERKRIFAEDCQSGMVPDVAHRVQVGDLITGELWEFAPARALMDSLGSGQWHTTIGNHDYANPGLTPEEAAVQLGMPAPNYVADVGIAVIVGFFVSSHPDAYTPDLTWLAAALDAHPDRVCLILAHPPFRGTVPNNAWEMTEADTTAIKAVLDSRPQAKAWLCGHSHNNLTEPLTQSVSMGSRDVLQINASALGVVRINDAFNRWDDIASLYLTVWDDRLEVRFRNHGAAQWVPGSIPNKTMQTYPL